MSLMINIIYIAPGDYAGVSRLVTFTPSQSSVFIVVGIVDDDISEVTIEFFSATATLVSSDTSGVEIDPANTTITIFDDEGKSFEYCYSCITCAEN